jgi:hypothetical protein
LHICKRMMALIWGGMELPLNYPVVREFVQISFYFSFFRWLHVCWVFSISLDGTHNVTVPMIKFAFAKLKIKKKKKI